MPGGLQDVTLQPGINAQITLAQNSAGISISNLIRIKDGLTQKLGGWDLYYPYQVSTGPVRDIHVFQGLRNAQKYLAVAAENKLAVISCGVLTDITPQYFTTTPVPSFTTASGSSLVLVNDPGSSQTTYGGIRLDTPVTIAGLRLSGAYQIVSVATTDTYTISASGVADDTISSGYTLPMFYCSSGDGRIGVIFPGHDYTAIVGLYYPFTAGTSVGGITIQGPYQVDKVLSSNEFIIDSPVPADTTVSSATPVTMNASLASIYHYVAVGAPQAGGAYGVGLYGDGLYGTGTLPPTGGSGTSLVVTDWVLDHIGNTLFAFAEDGPIYLWTVETGLENAVALAGGGAPVFNKGGFISQPQLQVMVWGSCLSTGQQHPLIIRWADIGSQDGYTDWGVTADSYAGSFQIPSGSALRAGIQGPRYAIFWTDIDVWAATWVGLPLVWSFTQVGNGCGALGKHAVVIQGGVAYWAGVANFFQMGDSGVSVVPCTVWDFFFQQLDTDNSHKVRCASNSTFNEVTWYFPVIGGSGENEAYVKMHLEPGGGFEWDYGYLDRVAWTDITAIGLPLGVDQNGYVYQHETSPNSAGTAMNSEIETGYFVIGDGTNLAFVDWILPDMRWNVLGGTTGTILFTFYATDYAGQPERVYGPYGVTEAVPFINTRIRGRFIRMRIESNDMDSFWRIGRCKFRWSTAGRR